MKKTKNYIDIELAKKKIARYKYWSVKDENGITISSSDEENEDNKSFSDLLDRIINDNVDAEIQVKYGTNEASSRNNPPFFIKINEDIEWIEPEEETVTINGKQHKVDKNGNVNINLSTPEVIQPQQPKIETAQIDTVRQEMEIRLNGLQEQHQLNQDKMALDTQNKLAEQMLKFKEMMLSDRESRITEREVILQQKEVELFDKENEMQGDLKGYLKQVPSALGSVIKELITDDKKDKSLGKANEKEEKVSERKERKKVSFSISNDDEFDDEELEEEIKRYQELENQEQETEQEKYEREFQELLIEEQNKKENNNAEV